MSVRAGEDVAAEVALGPGQQVAVGVVVVGEPVEHDGPELGPRERRPRR